MINTARNLLLQYHETGDNDFLMKVEKVLMSSTQTDTVSELSLLQALFQLEYMKDPDYAINLLEKNYKENKQEKAFLLMCYWKQGFSSGITQTEDDFLNTLEIDDNQELSSFRVFLRSEYYFSVGDSESGSQLLLKSIFIKPNYVNALIKLSLSYAEQKQRTLALETFEKAVSQIELIYTDVTADMLLNVDFYFQESVFGIYCSQQKLEAAKWMLNEGFE